jgi:hypothetical protein
MKMIAINGNTQSAVNEARFQLPNCSAAATFEDTLVSLIESHQSIDLEDDESVYNND